MRIFTALLAALAVGLLSTPAGALEVGQKAPQFAARSLDGGANLSLSKYKGKVVYLDFWASWCAPCLKSLPMMEELRKEFPASDFQVLAINVDKDADKARAFLKEHPVGYPSAMDPDGRLPEIFQLPTMPTSFLIDRDGVIQHIHAGFRSEDADDLRARIRALMEKK